MSKPGQRNWLLSDLATVPGAGTTAPVATSGDEWLDIGELADATFYIDTFDDAHAAVPEPRYRRDAPEFRGMRIMKGDQWEYDLVAFNDDAGSKRWRKIRFGESRGWRRGAVLQRAARRARK